MSASQHPRTVTAVPLAVTMLRHATALLRRAKAEPNLEAVMTQAEDIIDQLGLLVSKSCSSGKALADELGYGTLRSNQQTLEAYRRDLATLHALASQYRQVLNQLSTLRPDLVKSAATTVTAAPVYVYHGTASGSDDSRLRRILKEGLNPRPKTRTFKEQEEAELYKQELATYGGVYFAYGVGNTTKYMLQASKQVGGDRVLVIARIETRASSAAPDEDVFGGANKNLLDSWYRDNYNSSLGGYGAACLLLKQDFPWEQAAASVLSEELKEWKLSPQQLTAVLPLFVDLLKLNVQYVVVKDYQGDSWKSGCAGDWYKSVPADQQDPSKVLQRYRALHDQFLRKLKKLVNRPEGEEDNYYRSSYHTFRVLEPVAYSGANRIVAVVRITEPDDRLKGPYYQIGTVLYRTAEALPALKTAITELNERWSQNALWTDRDGTVLYDQQLPVENARAARSAGRNLGMKRLVPKKTVPRQFVAPASAVAAAFDLVGGIGTVGFSYEAKRWVLSHAGTRAVSPLHTAEVYKIYTAIKRQDLDKALELTEQQIEGLPETEFYDLTETVVTELETLGEKVKDITKVWERLRAGRLLRLAAQYQGKVVQIRTAVIQLTETTPGKPYKEILDALLAARPELAALAEEITAAKMAEKAPGQRLDKFLTRTEPGTWKKKPHETIAALPELRIDARRWEQLLTRHIAVLDQILASLQQPRHARLLRAETFSSAKISEAITLLQRVDFGQDPTKGLPILEQARKLVLDSGITPTDIELSIRAWAEDPEKASGFIHGPSGRGSGNGALADLAAAVEASKASAQKPS